MRMAVWRARTLALTFVLLAASLLLIPPGALGVGVSVPLLAALSAVGLVLTALRQRLAALPVVLGYDLGAYLRWVWVGPFLAVGLVLALAPNGSAGELQSVGGFAGFVGMANYFIRPLYFFLYNLARRLLSASLGSESRE